MISPLFYTPKIAACFMPHSQFWETGEEKLQRYRKPLGTFCKPRKKYGHPEAPQW
jgi:hypothetical protein